MIVVTGGAGAMGSRLVERLVKGGHAVRAIGLPDDPGQRAIRELGAEYVGVDIRDAAALPGAFLGADRVVHLAALILSRLHPERFEAINAQGTRNVIQAARSQGVAKLVHISSISVEYRHQNAYSLSKRAAEEAVRASGLDWTILRPTLAWGAPLATEYATFAKTVANLPLLPLPDGGRARKSPVHVDDLATAFESSLFHPRLRETTLPLCGPRSVTLREMAGMIRSARGTRGWTLPVPLTLARSTIRAYSFACGLRGIPPAFDWQTYTGLVEDAAPDGSDARRLLEWNPRPFDPRIDGLGTGERA